MPCWVCTEGNYDLILDIGTRVLDVFLERAKYSYAADYIVNDLFFSRT